MPQNIYAQSIKRGTFKDGRKRLYVEFAQNKNSAVEFQWTPKWMAESQGVAELAREALRVERANRPDSSYLEEFAQLARDILVEHAPPTEVRRETGSFVGYSADGRRQPSIEVQVREWTGTKFWEHGRQTWPLGIPLGEELLRQLSSFEKLLTWVTWNGELIDIRDDRHSLI